MTDKTAEQLRACLDHKFIVCVEDGTIRHRFNTYHRTNAGEIAGHIASGKRNGYRQITFEGRFLMVHRVVWLFAHGDCPKGLIDHIDGNKLNNRLSNLRECSIAQNAHNAKRASYNTSGLKGVALHNNRGGWMARVRHDGKQHRVLGFQTKEIAYDFACLMRDVFHGEFARHA